MSNGAFLRLHDDHGESSFTAGARGEDHGYVLRGCGISSAAGLCGELLWRTAEISMSLSWQLCDREDQRKSFMKAEQG